jgi:hypothetical protein
MRYVACSSRSHFGALAAKLLVAWYRDLGLIDDDEFFWGLRMTACGIVRWMHGDGNVPFGFVDDEAELRR